MKTNTLIIGQGIAGTLVAYMLHLQQIPFIVIDPARANTSSRIAAGMFTPISGKRKTIDPMVIQQIPFAIKIYKALEQLTGKAFLHLQYIYQVYHSIAEQTELFAKSANADFAKFIIANPNALPNIKQELGACEITHSGWVDCGLLISAFAEWLKKNNALIEARFLYEDLQINTDGMEYQGLAFNNIVFCEGYRAIDNPFFAKEKIIPCKGDLLTIQYDQPDTDRIIKKNGIYFIPLGNQLFRAGATYQWNNSNEQPDAAGRMQIESRLDAMLKSSYITINHTAGIRPTTQNREVIAKQHPEYAGMFMLNGLGTKGILQGPWWAKYISDLCLR